LVLSGQTIWFGQVTIIQLVAVIVIISALHANRPFVAGLVLPLVIIKPHLVIFFLFAALRRGGRKMLFAGIGSILLLGLISALTYPSWIIDMIQVVIYGQQNSTMEWNKFVTLAGLLSLPPWYSIVLWLLFIPVLVFLDNKFRSVPSIIWLPVTLVLSLATAPYAFAYDLPLLLPALVWLYLPLSPLLIVLLFIVECIVIFSKFSSIAYIAVILIALFSIRGTLMHIQSRVDELTPP
jgi:hypothetical protein